MVEAVVGVEIGIVQDLRPALFGLDAAQCTLYFPPWSARWVHQAYDSSEPFREAEMEGTGCTSESRMLGPS